MARPDSSAHLGLWAVCLQQVDWHPTRETKAVKTQNRRIAGHSEGDWLGHG